MKHRLDDVCLMWKIKTALFSVAVAFIAVATLDDACAADWQKTRSLAMNLREQRDYSGAYQAAAGHSGSSSVDMYDAQFISGWIALRNLNNANLAIMHFSKMAALAPLQRDFAKNASKAQAGYWLGRALSAAGRGGDAAVLYQAAARYPNTFYGQLAASEIKVGLTKNMISAYTNMYPDKSFYWLDQRTKKEFVLAIIREESSFKQTSLSPKGARGLMQVMPGTAKHIGRNAGVNVDLGMMASNEHYNVAVGSKYLADQMAKYRGNPMLAAAAYNAGPNRVDEWLQRFGDPRGAGVDPVDWVETIPFTETRDYVKKVIGSYITYMALAYNN
jgi:hypothetical protein